MKKVGFPSNKLGRRGNYTQRLHLNRLFLPFDVTRNERRTRGTAEAEDSSVSTESAGGEKNIAAFFAHARALNRPRPVKALRSRTLPACPLFLPPGSAGAEGRTPPLFPIVLCVVKKRRSRTGGILCPGYQQSERASERVSEIDKMAAAE